MQNRTLLRALFAFGLLTTCTSRTWAQAAPSERQSAAYYRGNVGASVLLFSGPLVLDALAPGRDCVCDLDWFPGDLSVRGRYSRSAARVSDGLVVATLASPEVFTLTQGSRWHFFNASVVYSQTLSADFALNTLIKLLFPRSRPYVYARDRDVWKEASDYDVSFYSSHSSLSFAAAVSGSYLYAESAQHPWAKRAAWGSELALATATANLRVRAGKHYYSDVLVGALMGTAFGVGVPLLHGARYRPDATECAAAASGVVLGALGSQLLPVSGDSGRQGAWSLTPYSVAGVLGVEASGMF